MPTTTPPIRKKTPGALRAFFRVGDVWGLDRRQRAILLASSERAIDRPLDVRRRVREVDPRSG